MKEKAAFVPISVIWFERFKDCSATLLTEYSIDNVYRFLYSLIDIGEGKLAIKTKVYEYFEKVWNLELENAIKKEMKKATSNTRGTYEFYRNRIESQYIIKLFQFITQTIQDSGVGWPTKEEMDIYKISQE